MILVWHCSERVPVTSRVPQGSVLIGQAPHNNIVVDYFHREMIAVVFYPYFINDLPITSIRC